MVNSWKQNLDASSSDVWMHYALHDVKLFIAQSSTASHRKHDFFILFKTKKQR